MTDRDEQFDRAGLSYGHNAVDRARPELRRGVPVLIADGAVVIAVVAAEVVTPENLAWLAAVAGSEPNLALTANRANVLHINPTGHDCITLPVADHMTADVLRGLADPTSDLDQPLRGPFQRDMERPADAVFAAVKLCKLAQVLPAAVYAVCGDGDGVVLTRSQGLLAVHAADVDAFETRSSLSLTQVTAAAVPLADAEDARILAFRPADGSLEHLAIVIGEPPTGAPVLTRLHSECFTGDLLGSLRCDCGEQLRGAVREITEAGGGILLYLAQEGRGIGLINKLRAYRLQDQGFDTIDANERLGFDADERVFLPAAEMLKKLGYGQVRLMTNNPDKMAGLTQYGIAVTERVPHAFPANNHNEFYLATKKRRSGHHL